MSDRFLFPVGADAESVRTQIGAVGPFNESTPPAVGEVLTWNGTAWVPGPGGGGGGVTSVGATAPITSTGGATPTIAITAATPLADGSMSAADKSKLDGIASGASIAGTIGANEVAYGSGANAIQGSAGFTFDAGGSGALAINNGGGYAAVLTGQFGINDPSSDEEMLEVEPTLFSMSIKTTPSLGAGSGYQTTIEAGQVIAAYLDNPPDSGGNITVQGRLDANTLVLSEVVPTQTSAITSDDGLGNPLPLNFVISELQINAAPGAAGEVLTSNGPGVAPTWQAGGGGTTGTIMTTDATPTAVVTLTPGSGTTTVYEATVTARKQGTTDAASYKLAGTFIEDAGTVTQLGSTDVVWSHESVGALDADFAIVGGTVELQVTGENPVGPVFTDPVAPPVPSGATWTVGTLGGEDYPDLATALADVNVVDGDLLYLSAETFTVAATIAVNKQVTIRGQGIGTTVLQTAATAADPVTMMTISVSNVTIQDLTMQQRKTTNTTVENCITINAGAGSSGHYLEGVRIETMELGVTIQSDGWQINNCQLYYAGATNQTAFLVIVYRSVGSGIVANTQVGHGVSTTTRSFLVRANGGANLLGGYLRFTNITLLPGEVSTSQFIICDAFSESGTLQLVVDNNNVNETSVFVAMFVDKVDLLNYFDYVAIYDNTISGTHGGAPIGCKGAFAVDGTGAGPQSMGSTSFYANGNTIGVTTFRAGWSTIMNTGLGYSADQLALAGWDSTYYSASPNLTLGTPVTADWDWKANVTSLAVP